MTSATNRRLLAALVSVATLSCGGPEAEYFDELEDDMDLFAASGKTDTGYVSDQAAEVNAEFSSKVTLDVASLPASERDSLVAKARAGDKTAFALFPTEQVKYARNVLKQEKFNANVESGAATIASVALVAGGSKIEIAYKLTVESLVKNKDLQAQGITLSQLIGRTVNLTLPADPRTAFVAGGLSCAQDPDVATEDISTEINDQNYFYYWTPTKPGCAIAKAAATFTVKNASGAKATYPEFNQLLADKKITLVAIFGQLEHGPLLSGPGDDNWDWGWIGYEDFTFWLEGEGYTEKSRTPARAELGAVSSSRWSKKYSTGLTVEVDVISPLELQDNADAARKDQIMSDAVKNHEVVYYNGHSFYGSLKVLENPANFPSSYQVVFMDSCWSYAYYTKQVFTSKTTAADPTGMLSVDVLNNTEPAISGSHETFQVFLKKFFVASQYVAAKQPAKAKNYTWKNLVSYMNTSAKKRAAEATAAGEVQQPEIYGVSGVTTNVWKP